MGKTILTPHQSQFLELIAGQPQITKYFYLTGGTALAEFYYQHRLSEDLDFFSPETEVDQVAIEVFLKKNLPKINVSQVKKSVFLGLVSFTLNFSDGQDLKLDFNYYPFPRIEPGKKYKALSVDSVYDIAVNKLHTLFMKPRSRDYIDLYFILSKEKYPLDKLIIAAKTKFDWHIDKVTLASQFLRTKDFDESAMMLVPLNKQKMDNFFLNLAKSLNKDIFKN
jgi:predicted nucleotidyltransferase component of viral defense system